MSLLDKPHRSQAQNSLYRLIVYHLYHVFIFNHAFPNSLYPTNRCLNAVKNVVSHISCRYEVPNAPTVTMIICPSCEPLQTC